VAHLKLTADTKCVVTEQRLAFIANCLFRWNTQPVAKGHNCRLGRRSSRLADLRSPGTIANIKKNPAVEVNVVDPFVRKGYRFKGVGQVIVNGPLFEEIMRF